ncbi:helicase-related protein [Leptothrix ochracea]|uniref:helicase-related protein n=1 Tax=Leptothrix ochracea TaxID=735331 RepID=UPI0034E2C62D
MPSSLPKSPAASGAAPRPRAFNLANARHQDRLPKHLSPEQVQRLRQAAFQLPQAVTAEDFLSEPATFCDTDLDQLGLILLQKAMPGVRPSRWIAPEQMDAALAHLEGLNLNPQTHALMQNRSATLEALGVQRNGLHWERRARQSLQLQAQGWRIAVAFTVRLDESAIWAFFRHGDLAALQASFGSAPAYPHAQELSAHLETLVERASSRNPEHLSSLLPALQSECALMQDFASLKHACLRALERWEHRAHEINTLEDLNSELAFQGYPDTFERARHLERKVTLLIGPPNSGKTYQAFERLAKAESGAYLAPLRLLALEGRDRLQERGVLCSLRTGEENVPVEGARITSSTIEMVGTREIIDVAVIDEAQMIFDPSRGWAWTQAIVAVPARELFIIASEYAVETLEGLLGLCGESCTIQRFERKQAVQLLPAPVPLNALHKGDAVVAFSRRDVLMLRDQISAHGHSVAVIYGALPPEVRRREAERFAQGAVSVLVATDAIGMGLNLPIRRVLFSTMTKFDGQGDRLLTDSEVHQIAGRAGRFGLHEEGFTGVLKEAEPSAAKTLRQLLPQTPRAPRQFKAPVAPNGWHIDTISARLGKTGLHDVLKVFMDQLQLDSAHFAVAELEQMLTLAEQLDQNAASLNLRQRFTYAQAPVDTRTEAQVQAFLSWARSHAETGMVASPWFLHEVDEYSRLDRMEQALRACALWLWLDLRFPGVYADVADVIDLRHRLNDGIERQIKSHKPLWQSRTGGRPRQDRHR